MFSAHSKIVYRTNSAHTLAPRLELAFITAEIVVTQRGAAKIQCARLAMAHAVNSSNVGISTQHALDLLDTVLSGVQQIPFDVCPQIGNEGLVSGDTADGETMFLVVMVQLSPIGGHRHLGKMPLRTA